jgi:hypothetical protein
MSDDIVTRLRIVSNLQKLHKSDDLVDDLLGFWLEEAADEIERLRAEVAYLKSPCPRCDYEEN